jgi:predicted small secreted protein
MKKMIAVLAAVAALALAVAAPNANAGACRTVKCFNKQVSRLQAEVVELQTGMLKVANALNCVQPVAVSRYPGYDYNGYAAATTALDFTESGDQVSTWVLGIPPGSCGSPTTRSVAQSASKSSGTGARDASPFGPFQALPDATSQKDRSTLGGGR